MWRRYMCRAAEVSATASQRSIDQYVRAIFVRVTVCDYWSPMQRCHIMHGLHYTAIEREIQIEKKTPAYSRHLGSAQSDCILKLCPMPMIYQPPACNSFVQRCACDFFHINCMYVVLVLRWSISRYRHSANDWLGVRAVRCAGSRASRNRVSYTPICARKMCTLNSSLLL